jgi:SAM-dependent methyltransferase
MKRADMHASTDRNVEANVARGFGKELSTFRQGEDSLLPQQRDSIFADYFRIFPWHLLPPGGVGIDVGCGSRRWSMLVAPSVAHLRLLDVSPEALAVAPENLKDAKNVSFHADSVAEIPLPTHSVDFAFSLGVLHHVADTQMAIRPIAEKLKPGAPFLVYLYYSFYNRPAWYRTLWSLSNAIRVVVSRLPNMLQKATSAIIARLVCWPLARAAGLLACLDLRCRPCRYPGVAANRSAARDAAPMIGFARNWEGDTLTCEMPIERIPMHAGFETMAFSDAPQPGRALAAKSA